ncbi:Fungal trans [Geosmithia morbida]|uniref:Fungal trans n=1 Tax=Geosmithia morbida TaxID=1094350 RepID=A0A9P4YQ37_9HYPO|nr:Fungal trans [Geosmithia morbida]KAF4120675.1 Fungal trans [Geosmithia morbida]
MPPNSISNRPSPSGVRKRSTYTSVAWTTRFRNTTRQEAWPRTLASASVSAGAGAAPTSNVLASGAAEDATSAAAASAAAFPLRNNGSVHRGSRLLGWSNPGSFDYLIRLAESRLAAESPEQSARPRPNTRQTVPIWPEQLRELASRRRSGGSVLDVLDMKTWTGILETYHDELGMQYPFLDTEELVGKIQAMRAGRTQGAVDYSRAADVACVVVGLVSCMVSAGSADAANPLVHDVFGAAMVRVHTEHVHTDDLAMLILTSLFFFLSDREVEAWRCIGTVMRLVHELCQYGSDDQRVSDALYWSVYTLERRWSFGTGLPFAVPDADVETVRQLSPQDDASDLVSGYLRQMVTYCAISSEVRRKFLDLPSAPAPTSASASHPPNNNHDSVRDWCHFRIVQWQNNLPRHLRFRGPDEDKYDSTLEGRGEYKLRLMLYLRANQMRTIILRKSAIMSAAPPIVVDEGSTTHTMLEAARDSIRLLSHITKKLHDKLKVIQKFVDSLKPSQQQQQQSAEEMLPPAPLPQTPTDGISNAPALQNLLCPGPEPPNNNVDPDSREQQAGPALAPGPLYAGLEPPAGAQTANMSSFWVPHGTPDDFRFMDDGGVATELHMLSDLDESRLRELNDILMDYENFKF